MSKESAQLRAQVEILQQINEEIRQSETVDRRTMTGLLNSLSTVTERLDELPPLIARIEDALQQVETGRLLGTTEMAERVGLHPVTLRQKAQRGEVPAYQTVNGGNWFYDPLEVKRALTAKESGRAPVTQEAADRAAAAATGCSYDELRDNRNRQASIEQINKEMERGL